MKAKIINKQELVKDFWQIELESLEGPINFEPGQFFDLTLINPPFTDDRKNSRYFGFTNLPGSTNFQMVMKNGISAFKKSLLSLPMGTQVEIDNLGGENNIAKNPNAQIVFIAGGIGIAPIISMIRFYVAKNITNKLVLFYANDYNEALPFIPELQEYADKNHNFKLVLRPALDENVVKENLEEVNSCLYFIKGDQKFTISTLQLIKSLGVEANKISIEIFTGY